MGKARVYEKADDHAETTNALNSPGVFPAGNSAAPTPSTDTKHGVVMEEINAYPCSKAPEPISPWWQ